MSTNSIVGIYDGATEVWSHSSSGEQVFAGGACTAVAYNGIAGASGLWVAGGGDARNGDGSAHYIAYSDGVSWTGSASGDALFAGGLGCLAVAYGNGLWVAGGDEGSDPTIAYSSNGISWTGSTSGSELLSKLCTAVAYNGTNLWVAGGVGRDYHYIAYSSDGKSWTGSASGDAAFTGGECRAVAYNGINLWVAGGEGDHKIAYSSNGISWTGSASGDLAFTGGQCNAVAYNGIAGASGLWVAGGYGDHKIAYSSNGISWTGSTSGDLLFTGGECLAVAYNTGSQLWTVGGRGDFVSQYSSNYIATSRDGISWTGSASGNSLFNGLYGACFALATNNQSSPTERWILGGATYIPPEPTPPPVVYSYVPSSSSFNTFPTNYRGMGNLGEY